MALDVGGIALFMGPQSLGASDDLERVIIDFIGSVDDTLDIAVQELESKAITEAILAARGRKVRVRIVLERDYLTERTPLDDPWTPGGRHRDNREMYSALLRAKVPVITDLNPNIFHQKFMVKDWATSSKAEVLTGSTNFTPTGTSRNLNHVLVIRGKRTATVFKKEFDELWSGTFGEKREPNFKNR